jgi:type IV pilus assembly protein PilX
MKNQGIAGISIARQRGMALISSILLLIIITILALSMFRSFGVQERLAGNVREKERALHAATSAQQFAEYWLTLGRNAPAGGLGAVSCTTAFLLNANNNEGQICDTNSTLTALGVNVTAVPWTVGGNPTGVTFLPAGMGVGANGAAGDPGYFATPVFYIGYLGTSPDGTGGDLYQIDAVGYGGTANTVAVVESVYEVSQGVTCLGC